MHSSLKDMPMALTLSQASLPVFRRALENLARVVIKSADHFAATPIPEAEWLDARLAPDMLPLPRQIQMASDSAKNVVARLAGATPPSFVDEEKTVAELLDRIARTIAYLDSIDPATIDGREEAEVVLKTRNSEVRSTAIDHLNNFGLPNFFFHVVTAYAIMRSKGAPIGKMDYLGGI
jgi:hypothetical protein